MKVFQSCEIGGCENRSVNNCPVCKHWIPSTGSKYYYCSRYILHRLTCDLPKSACETCVHKIPKSTPGAPRTEYTPDEVDWSNKDSIKEYRNKKRKESRQKYKEQMVQLKINGIIRHTKEL